MLIGTLLLAENKENHLIRFEGLHHMWFIISSVKNISSKFQTSPS